MSLRVLSLNMEGSNHLERISAYLQQEQFDVINLQEAPKKQVAELAATAGYLSHFLPMARTQPGSDFFGPDVEVMGLAQLFRHSLGKHGSHYYFSYGQEKIPTFDPQEPNSVHRAVLWGEFTDGEHRLPIGTTHFTWSTGGSETEEQRTTLQSLLSFIETFPQLVLTGDFNIPRQHDDGGFNSLYLELKKHFTDNVPSHYDTSIDQQLHRHAPLTKMVDYFWSTPQVQVENFQMVNGLSDHQGEIATVQVR